MYYHSFQIVTWWQPFHLEYHTLPHISSHISTFHVKAARRTRPTSRFTIYRCWIRPQPPLIQRQIPPDHLLALIQQFLHGIPKCVIVHPVLQRNVPHIFQQRQHFLPKNCLENAQKHLHCHDHLPPHSRFCECLLSYYQMQLPVETMVFFYFCINTSSMSLTTTSSGWTNWISRSAPYSSKN